MYLRNNDGLYFNLDKKEWQAKKCEFYSLRGANLSGANLSGVDLQGHNFNGANLNGADLSGANLSNCTISHGDLRGADLLCAIANGVDFTCSSLCGTNLSGAWLMSSNFAEASLHNADLTGANLRYTSWYKAKLDGAKLDGAIITNVVNGNGKEIKTIQLCYYDMVLCGEVLAVGCKQYTIKQWLSFSHADIEMMDYNKDNEFLVGIYKGTVLPLINMLGVK